MSAGVVGLQVVQLADGWTVLLDCIAWAGVSAVAGYGLHRAPLRWFDRDRGLLRLRPWERGGRVYERRLAVRRWKDVVPEAGNLFSGGFDKGRLVSRDRRHLERYRAETRRAECVHWVIAAAGPLFVLWNRPLLFAAMLTYAVAANAPFIVIQRYNRARLDRVLARAVRPAAVGAQARMR